MKIEWSAHALADLDRFAEFLEKTYPSLVPVVGKAILAKAAALEEYPMLGRPIAERPEYRQMALKVLNAIYIFQYPIQGDRLIMLRVFNAREFQG
jgi:plasmid stabilization system protein ParE